MRLYSLESNLLRGGHCLKTQNPQQKARYSFEQIKDKITMTLNNPKSTLISWVDAYQKNGN